MKLSITSIQRDRGPYILEWIAFHMVVGVNKFYIYNHGDDAQQKHILLKLSEKLPGIIHAQQVGAIDRPQIAAYQHAWAHHKNDVDAMAFIDGDEFLFSPGKNLTDEVARLFEQHRPCSALGVYWTIYGSSGHYQDPQGLIIENFTRHARPDFVPNRHIKTILRGGSEAVIEHSHLFHTEHGTVDELGRTVTSPWMRDWEPSSDSLRLNHYTVQSYEFFLNKKKNSGQADLLQAHAFARPDSWFEEYDRNECDDGVIYNYITKTKIQLAALHRLLQD